MTNGRRSPAKMKKKIVVRKYNHQHIDHANFTNAMNDDMVESESAYKIIGDAKKINTVVKKVKKGKCALSKTYYDLTKSEFILNNLQSTAYNDRITGKVVPIAPKNILGINDREITEEFSHAADFHTFDNAASVLQDMKAAESGSLLVRKHQRPKRPKGNISVQNYDKRYSPCYNDLV